MRKTVKPEITIEKMGDNPFAEKLVIPVNRLTMAGQFKKDKDGVYLPVEVEVEDDRYCRLYVDKERRLRMSGLSPRAKDLLLWVMMEVETGEQWVWINRPRYMRENGVKAYNTYKDAVSELVKKGFLNISVIHSTYWINPNCFFNGSRINAFPNNVKVK